MRIIVELRRAMRDFELLATKRNKITEWCIYDEICSGTRSAFKKFDTWMSFKKKLRLVWVDENYGILIYINVLISKRQVG